MPILQETRDIIQNEAKRDTPECNTQNVNQRVSSAQCDEFAYLMEIIYLINASDVVSLISSSWCDPWLFLHEEITFFSVRPKSLLCVHLLVFFPTIFIKILQSLSCVKIIIFHSLLLLVSPLWTTLGSFASPLADRQIKMIDLRNATPKSWWFDLKTCDFTSLTSFSVI